MGGAGYSLVHGSITDAEELYGSPVAPGIEDSLHFRVLYCLLQSSNLAQILPKSACCAHWSSREDCRPYEDPSVECKYPNRVHFKHGLLVSIVVLFFDCKTVPSLDGDAAGNVGMEGGVDTIPKGRIFAWGVGGGCPRHSMPCAVSVVISCIWLWSNIVRLNPTLGGSSSPLL